MKMKKIIALGLSAIMMLTATIASAELVVDHEEQIIITLPTAEEIAARNPEIEFDLGEKYATDADVKNATNRGFSTNYPVATYDVYPLTVTISSIGDLASAWNDDRGAYVYSSLLGMTFMLKTKEIAGSYTKTSWGDATFAGAQSTLEDEYFQFTWSKLDFYPVLNEDDTLTYVEDAPIIVNYTIAVAKDAVVNINSFKGIVEYKIGVDSDLTMSCTNVKFPESLTIGAAPVVPDPEPAKPVITGTAASTDVTVTDDNKGKVWNGIKIEDVTLGTNYRVQFTSGSEKSPEFALNLNNKEVNGDVDFAVVLKTAKTLADITMEILYDVANAQ